MMILQSPLRFNLPADPEQQPSRVRRSQSQPRLSGVVSRLEQETMSFTNKKTQAKRRTVSRSPDSHKRNSLLPNPPSPRQSPQRVRGTGESVLPPTSTSDKDSGQSSGQ